MTRSETEKTRKGIRLSRRRPRAGVVFAFSLGRIWEGFGKLLGRLPGMLSPVGV